MTPLLLRGVRVWKGDSSGYAPDVDAIRIEGDRIASIGRSGELRQGAEELDMRGASVLPGLVDAHVHLSIDPCVPSPHAQLDMPAPQVREAMRGRARAMLRAGITTARDLGGPCWREVELRDAIDRGEQVGPRLLCAGQPLTTPGGHAWFWGGEVRDRAEGFERIAQQVERGVDWIKLIATGGRITAGSKPEQAQFDAAEIRALVAEASRLGRPVAAHCHATPGIRNAAAAPVRSVEHCSFAGEAGFGSDFDAGVAEALASAGCWVSPTVNAGWRRQFARDGAPKPFAQRMRAVYAGLRSAGVRLIASTDAGIPGVAHDRLAEALEVFGRIAELAPAEVLRCATSESAEALGLERVTGRLRAGLSADLLVVDGDPLSDLAALQTPLLVIARGVQMRPGSAERADAPMDAACPPSSSDSSSR